MIKLIAFICLYSTITHAQTPTVVFGASELPNHEPDSFLVVQPEGAPNPLGNPIVTVPQNNISPDKEQNQDLNQSNNVSDVQNLNQNQIEQISEQNPQPFSSTPEQLQNKIENTLYQGGNRIYDIQSFPVKDIKEITKPNIQPTITDYPDY